MFVFGSANNIGTILATAGGFWLALCRPSTGSSALSTPEEMCNTSVGSPRRFSRSSRELHSCPITTNPAFPQELLRFHLGASRWSIDHDLGGGIVQLEGMKSQREVVTFLCKQNGEIKKYVIHRARRPKTLECMPPAVCLMSGVCGLLALQRFSWKHVLSLLSLKSGNF